MATARRCFYADSTLLSVDCHMHKTGKGIYMKFRSSGGVVSDVTYENVVFDQPQQANMDWPSTAI